jgi:hypothetical protein
VGFSDELRVGVHGTVRRVWGRRGVKIRQRVQFSSRWRYLVLVVDGRSGRIWWNCNETMQADELIPLVRGMADTTDREAVVWDGAPRHRDDRRSRIGLPLIAVPPYRPELNPAEPKWMHGKRAVVAPDCFLSTRELEERVCAYYGCEQLPHLTITEEVA